ncbi:phage tail tape measure protein [Emcibacter sp.]|uniref:phage tail tape measure protein n=1 Tax=Emcibacter sp. TaxID=1979954 RepID=UPI002AA89026|nr:phage tail tape measure protein [Emcibacter sp.]
MNDDIEVGVKVSADSKQARKELKTTGGEAVKASNTVGKAVQKQAGETRKLDKSNQKAAASQSRLGKVVDRARRETRSYNDETKKAIRNQTKLGQAAKRTAQSLNRSSGLINGSVGNLAAGATASVAIGKTIGAAISFESAMADIRKVVQFETPEQFKQMGSDIRRLSTEIPIAAEGIAEIIAEAGQAGVARDELLGFANDAAKMSVAFDIAAREAGDTMAGLRAIFQLPQEDVVKLGDSVNHLSNNMNAKAPDILNILNRAGSTGKLLGLSGQQIASLGAAFLELKSPPEIAARSMNAMFNKLATADRQSSDFQNTLEELGIDIDDFKDRIKNDAQGTFIDFLETVKRSDDVMGTLTDLFGLEYADDMAKLVGGIDSYKKAIKLTAKEGNFAGSMFQEFKARTDTTGSGLEILSNSFGRLGGIVGDRFLPAIQAGGAAIGSVVNQVADLAEEWPKVTTAIAGTVAALSLVKVGAAAKGILSFLRGGRGGGVAGMLGSASGVTPVFVTNMGGGMGGFGGGKGRAGRLGRFGRLGRLAGRIGGSGIMRTGGKLLGKAAVPLMVGMSLFDTVSAASRGDAKGVGGGLGGLGGALGGAAAGAAIGSVVPVVGTAIGGIIGGLIGSFGGEAIGRKIGGLFSSDERDKTAKAAKAAVASTMIAATPAAASTAAPVPQQVTNEYKITITATEGMSIQDLVREVVDEIERQTAIKQRGALYDND